MKYYCTSDIHGYYGLFKNALEKSGYFRDPEPHKLVILGDLFDRGSEAVQLQDFILQLMDRDEVILIKGNHESLFEALATGDEGRPLDHHIQNGTFRTALDLTGFRKETAMVLPSAFAEAARGTPFYMRIIPSMKDYFETEHYIFVHGWIPAQKWFGRYVPVEDWRKAAPGLWERARWTNGMDAVTAVREKGKTIVCGHRPASYGHTRGGKGSEFGPDVVWSPYYGEGILALDACTAVSGAVNIAVVDEPLE